MSGRLRKWAPDLHPGGPLTMPQPRTSEGLVGPIEWKPERVHFASILQAGGFQVRTKIDPGTVSRYSESMVAGQQLPPLRLARIEGKHALYLLDGAHRLAALKKQPIINEVEEVWAEVGTFPNHVVAAWEAARANMACGLPMKDVEIKKAFKIYVQGGGHRKGPRKKEFKTYRELGTVFGKGKSTMQRWMTQMFPGVARAMAGGEDAMRGDRTRFQPPTPDEVNREEAREAIAKVLSHYSTIECPAVRGRVLMYLEEAGQKMAGMEHTKPPPDEF